MLDCRIELCYLSRTGTFHSVQKLEQKIQVKQQTKLAQVAVSDLYLNTIAKPLYKTRPATDRSAVLCSNCLTNEYKIVVKLITCVNTQMLYKFKYNNFGK
jgi:hypothetical protein